MKRELNAPWTIHPALTLDRLSHLAELIRDARNGTIRLHDPSQGDTPWSLGCRCYARSCFAISQAAKEVYADWLKVIDGDGLHFVFSVGGVPLRFYRGDLEKPNPRYRLRRVAELEAQQMAFDFRDSQGFQDLVLRLVVESNEMGLSENIFLVQLNSRGAPTRPYEIPVEPRSERVVSMDQLKEGRELQPPRLGRKAVEEERDKKAE